MARILVTGSTDGLGHSTAASLLDDGHEVIVHARTEARLAAVAELLDRGAESVVGDFEDLGETIELADQLEQLDQQGPIDVVIHNAGVFTGPTVLPVNVVAPYVVTKRLATASRHIYLSSGLHRDGRADLTNIDWGGKDPARTYDDSKLFVTVLMAAIARLKPGVISHAVDPGWMPTKMGGPRATGDIRLGHVTQAWLATATTPEVLESGQYWHYQQVRETHPAVHDERFQDALLASLATYTGC